MPATAPRLLASLFAFAVLATLAAPACAQPGFGASTSLPIGSLPKEVALADVDQDGHLDLIATCEGETFVGVFLGNGDGTFAPRIEVPTADGPRAMAVVDWNGDGRLDILVCANGSPDLASYLGQGDGTFTPGPSVALPSPVTRLQVADLDGDGDLDVAASTSFGVTRLLTLLGTGGGGFGPVAGADSLGGAQAFDLAIAQLDGLGAPDIMLPLTCDCPSHLLIGQGGGTFAPPINLTGTTHSQGVIPVDLGQDGIVDLVVSDAGTGFSSNGGVRVLRGLGGGSFSTGPFVATGRGAAQMALGPWGGPTETDVVVANSTPTTISIVRILCDGTILGIQNRAVGAGPVDVVVGDVDEDGVADIVTANQGAGTATIQLMLPNLNPYPCNPQGGISASVLDFGSLPQGLFTDRTVTVQCIGTVGFDVTSATVGGSFEFVPSPPNLPRHLAPGASVDIPVRYVRSALGSQSAVLSIGTTDVFHPTFHVDLTGVATPPMPVLAVDTSLVDFGADLVGKTEQAIVKVHNAGSLTMSVAASLDDPQFQLIATVPSIPAGGVGDFVVRYLRTHRGAAAATLTLDTNDPNHPQAQVPFIGEALPLVPRIELGATLLDYGAKFQNSIEDKAVLIKNVGGATLTVFTLTTSGSADFSVLAPGTPFTIAPGASVNRTVRYSRATLGDAAGTFHVASDDSLVPETTVALEGSASLPPAIAVSAPARPSLTVGTNTAVPIVVRNTGTGPLTFTPAAIATDLAEISPGDLGNAALPLIRVDAGAGGWDIQENGGVRRGTTGEFAGAMTLAGFAPQPFAALGLGGREVRLGPAGLPSGLMATRKVWFGPTSSFARWATVLENPTGAPIATTLDTPDTIAYFPDSPPISSSGNGSFTIDDSWVAFPPDAAPDRRTVGRVSRTTVAPHGPTLSNYSQTFFGYLVRLRYGLTVPAHGRVVLLGWGIQGASVAEATAEAAEITAGAPEAFAGLAAIDRAALWNAPPSPAVFRTPGLPINVPPGDSVIVQLTCDATGATNDAAIDGTLRLVSNDPLHPEVVIPIGLDVTGGQVVGVPPPHGTDTPAPKLALAGLVPNPAPRGGAVRVVFTLASAAPATLTAYDVRGRVLTRHALAAPSPGPGSLELGAHLPAGVVWLRLEQSDHRVTRKAIVLP